MAKRTNCKQFVKNSFVLEKERLSGVGEAQMATQVRHIESRCRELRNIQRILLGYLGCFIKLCKQ